MKSFVSLLYIHDNRRLAKRGFYCFCLGGAACGSLCYGTVVEAVPLFEEGVAIWIKRRRSVIL